MVAKKDPSHLSDKELSDAEHEAAKELAKEAAKAEIATSTGTDSEVDEDTMQYHGSDEIMMWAHIVELPFKEFEAALDPKADHPVPEDKIAGLYKLERNGQNRTPYVKLLRERLGLKKGEDVPGAGGPDYTNDVTQVSDL